MASLAVPASAGVATVAAPTALMPFAAGTPGTPQPGVEVYAEDFENTGSAPISLSNYIGAGSLAQGYTADAVWLTNCNGVVISQLAPSGPTDVTAGGCLPGSVNSVKGLAGALGTFAGNDPATNHAVTAYTQAPDPGADMVQLQTTKPITVMPNRFYSFSVDAAAFNCNGNPHPLLNFKLLDGGDIASPITSAPIDVCDRKQDTIGGAAVGRFYADAPILFAGTSLRVQMTNSQGSSTGNDAAVDNLRVIDATPQLDKSFASGPHVPGAPATLTFTVTNTDELGAKPGLSFTDNLPAGLMVATPNGASTTCGAGSVTAPAGGTSVSIAGGLDAGDASCTATVNVTATSAGIFTNGPANISGAVGVSLPANASTSFAFPTPAITGPVNGATVGSTAPISGTGGLPGAPIKIVDNGGNTVCSTTVAADGTYSCTPTTPLPAGANTLTPVQTNTDGTPSTGSPVNVTVTKTPAITGPVDGATVGSQAPIKGTGEPGAPIKILDKGGKTVCSTIIAADGTYSCTPTTPLPAGANTLTPVQTNPDNSTTTGAPVNVVVAQTPAITGPVDGATVGNQAPISGTGLPGAPITIKDNGGNTVCSTMVAADGTFACTPTTPLPAGANALTPIQTNPDGSSTTGIPVNVVVAPAPAITGPKDGDTIGNQAPISGTGLPGAPITIKDKGGSTVCSTVVAADGTFSCMPTTPLPAGANALTPVQSNPDGTTTAGAAVNVAVAPTPAITGPVDGATVGPQTPISGTGLPGAPITVKDKDGNTVCSTVVATDATFSCTPMAPLPAGPNTLTPVQTNPDNTTTIGAPVNVTVTKDPAISGPKDGDTVGSTAPISGTGQPGAPVKILDKDGNTVCSTTVAADGTYTCVPAKPLPAGANTLTPVQTNPDGTTTAGTPVNVTVTKDPAIAGPKNGDVLGPQAPIAGTGEPGAPIKIVDKDGTTVCETVVGADGKFSCTPTKPLLAGANTLTPVQTNPDGSTSAGAPISITVVPTPDIAKQGNGNGRSINGSGQPGAHVKILDNDGNTVCETTVGADGKYSCTPSKPLPAGVNKLTIVQTNPDGSTSINGPFDITVTNDGDLATTGASVAAPLGIAGGLLLIGGILTFVRLRRRNEVDA
ncbi:Ig-like domain-containing protein [Arthrobacter sp. GMC3]|uniref:Ig-like domain-containing protein n=1 Tax=Arthrobacter sp. GMC3 TaxID=2058894 RepID=UPI000CE56DC1|nr:Ig-like domain-containing protein [Arthrobacter sp. GMC3]